jgi:hypothetical protein
VGANRRSLARRWRDALLRCTDSLRRAPSAFQRFLRLPVQERRTLLHALVTLLFVEATIRWTRLPRIASALGVRLHVDPQRPSAAPSYPPPPPPPDADLAVAIVDARRNVARVMDVWPLGAGPCLRSSLVLGHLIRDRDPVLRLGVARVGHRLRAHAWIEVDGVPVNDPEGFLAFGAGAGRATG